MAKLTTQPKNPNFLNNNQFRFTLKRAPNVVFFTQSVPIPGLVMPIVNQPNPFVDIPRPGQRIEFEPLTLTFKVDEDFGNYLEIFNWIIAMGFPDSFDQYKALTGQSGRQTPRPGFDGVFSDGTLTVLDSSNNPNIEVKFIEMFPMSMTSLDLTNTVNDSEKIDCTVTFAYQRFFIDKLRSS